MNILTAPDFFTWPRKWNFDFYVYTHRRTQVGRIAARISRTKRVSLHKKYGAPVFIAAVFLLSRTTTLETFSRGSVMPRNWTGSVPEVDRKWSGNWLELLGICKCRAFAPFRKIVECIW